MNNNTGMLIDVLENMYTLTVNMKSKTLEKMIRVLVIIISSKIMEIVVDNKIVTAVEIIKIINNNITLNDVWVIIELWVMWILYSIKMNTNIILINVYSIIIIKITALIMKGIIMVNEAVRVMAISLFDNIRNIPETQNKGIRSCIPFV